MDIENDQKGAAVKFPAPLIFFIFMLLAGVFQYYWPASFTASIALKFTGGIAIIVGLVIVIAASRTFKRVDTNIEPWKPTSKIVSTGVFAYSRNPIYASFCLASIGVGLISGSFWVLISFVPAVITVYLLVIKKEESYLEHKFGDEYRIYKSNVRRWL